MNMKFVCPLLAAMESRKTNNKTFRISSHGLHQPVIPVRRRVLRLLSRGVV